MALVGAGVVGHNHGLSESPVDTIGVLSKKLVQFEKTFNHRSVDKATALNFAAQLSSLSDRIMNSYSQEQPDDFIDLTETLGLQDPVETDGNYHGFIACGVSKEAQIQSPRCSRRPPSRSASSSNHAGSRANKGIDISEIGALGYECAMKKQQKLQSEASEILSKVKKSPSTFQCGMGYTDGTPAEKRFSDNVKDIVHENLPELRIKKNIFHYMAFATLDRFYCKCCLRCPNKPEMLYRWVEARSSNLSRPLSPRPMVSPRPMAVQQSTAAAVTGVVDNTVQVYRILQKKSFEWDNIGRELKVEFKFRELLRKEGTHVMTSESKLERVLQRWIESECSEPTWSTLIEALQVLRFNDLVRDVKEHLNSNPRY